MSLAAAGAAASSSSAAAPAAAAEGLTCTGGGSERLSTSPDITSLRQAAAVAAAAVAVAAAAVALLDDFSVCRASLAAAAAFGAVAVLLLQLEAQQREIEGLSAALKVAQQQLQQQGVSSSADPFAAAAVVAAAAEAQEGRAAAAELQQQQDELKQQVKQLREQLQQQQQQHEKEVAALRARGETLSEALETEKRERAKVEVAAALQQKRDEKAAADLRATKEESCYNSCCSSLAAAGAAALETEVAELRLRPSLEDMTALHKQMQELQEQLNPLKASDACGDPRLLMRCDKALQGMQRHTLQQLVKSCCVALRCLPSSLAGAVSLQQQGQVVQQQLTQVSLQASGDRGDTTGDTTHRGRRLRSQEREGPKHSSNSRSSGSSSSSNSSKAGGSETRVLLVLVLESSPPTDSDLLRALKKRLRQQGVRGVCTAGCSSSLQQQKLLFIAKAVSKLKCYAKALSNYAALQRQLTEALGPQGGASMISVEEQLQQQQQQQVQHICSLLDEGCKQQDETVDMLQLQPSEAFVSRLARMQQQHEGQQRALLAAAAAADARAVTLLRERLQQLQQQQQQQAGEQQQQQQLVSDLMSKFGYKTTEEFISGVQAALRHHRPLDTLFRSVCDLLGVPRSTATCSQVEREVVRLLEKQKQQYELLQQQQQFIVQQQAIILSSSSLLAPAAAAAAAAHPTAAAAADLSQLQSQLQLAALPQQQQQQQQQPAVETAGPHDQPVAAASQETVARVLGELLQSVTHGRPPINAAA
ncbi:hypothetical protein Emag_003272 [Eimeria magna]